MKYLYKYPQAEFPYARAAGGEPAAWQGPAGVRIARHWSLQRRPLLRCVRGIRQGRHRRHPDQDHGCQPWAGSGEPAPVAHGVVPQHLVVGRTRAAAGIASGTPGPDPVIELNHHQPGNRWLHCEGSPELLFTENETNTRLLVRD